MRPIRLYRATLVAIALGLFTTNASSEEISVVTFVPPHNL